MKSIRIDKKKLRKLTPTKDPFVSLARSIIFQQLSTKSATSIWNKFVALFPNKGSLTPRGLLTLTDRQFKSAGVSPQKISYLRDLAQKFADKSVDHKRFHKMSEEEIKEHLIVIKGIGPWTIDMFLIFALNRPDVLPVGDLGVMKGFQKVFGLKKLPSARTMERLARPYTGKRTYLTLYLWKSLDGD